MFAALAAATILLAGGCGVPPPPGTPVPRAELAELAEALKARECSADALRGSGAAKLCFAGRTFNLSFALLYIRPDWLRLDLRPSAGAISAAGTALSIVSADCAATYIPRRGLEVSGCLADLADKVTLPFHPASIVAGTIGAPTLRRLQEPRVERGARELVVVGSVATGRAEIVIDREELFVKSLSLESPTGERFLSVSYSDRGSDDGPAAPGKISITLGAERNRRIEIELEYMRLRSCEAVDRGAYALDVPPDVTSIHWSELEF